MKYVFVAYFCIMPNKPDERLIILLPPDLLEEVRRAAEAEDLSVSQIVRRALRNELKAITRVTDADPTLLENLGRLLLAAQKDGFLKTPGTTEAVPGATPKLEKIGPKLEKIGPTDAAKILRVLRDRK